MSQDLTRTAPAPVALTVSEEETNAVREAFAINIGSGSITEFDLPRIKPVNGEALWKIPTLEGHQTAQSIEGVIVFARDTRAYYPGKEIRNQPPDCSSIDGITGVAKAGVNLGGACKQCAHAQWDSATDGSGAQGCKQSKQLFMLRGTSRFLEVVSLPPTSLKAVRQFFLKLVTQGVQYHQCIVRIDLVEAKNAQQQPYGKADMKFVRRLSAEESARAADYRGLAESIAARVDVSVAAE
jgi:hypothetical protein